MFNRNTMIFFAKIFMQLRFKYYKLLFFAVIAKSDVRHDCSQSGRLPTSDGLVCSLHLYRGDKVLHPVRFTSDCPRLRFTGVGMP